MREITVGKLFLTQRHQGAKGGLITQSQVKIGKQKAQALQGGAEPHFVKRIIYEWNRTVEQWMNAAVCRARPNGKAGRATKA